MNFKFNEEKLDFIKHRNKFFLFTVVTIILGLVFLATTGLNLGIDFENGTKVEVLSGQSLTAEQVTADFAEIDLSPDSILLAGEQSQMAYATFIDILSQEEIIKVQQFFNEKYGSEPNISIVTPMIGRELARNAFYSVIFAAIGIAIYVAIRFELLYGIAAIAGLLFDAFFVLAVFSIVQVEVNLPFIAAVLTVVGYSINDKIVTFDRIKENIALEKKIKSFTDLANLVNRSLVQTLSRTVNTILTVLFAAIALLIFGGEPIRAFSFALVIGLLIGTYSSLLLSPQLWLIMKGKNIGKKPIKVAKNEE